MTEIDQSERVGVKDRVLVFNATFQQYFSYIVMVSFIGGGNWSTRRKPLTCRKSQINGRKKLDIKRTN
jgi:hypothetical protein